MADTVGNVVTLRSNGLLLHLEQIIHRRYQQCTRGAQVVSDGYVPDSLDYLMVLGNLHRHLTPLVAGLEYGAGLFNVGG